MTNGFKGSPLDGLIIDVLRRFWVANQADLVVLLAAEHGEKALQPTVSRRLKALRAVILPAVGTSTERVVLWDDMVSVLLMMANINADTGTGLNTKNLEDFHVAYAHWVLQDNQEATAYFEPTGEINE